MIVNIPSSGGIHTRTEFSSGNLTFAPVPLISTYPGDSDWQHNSPDVTYDGDVATVNNQNNNHNWNGFTKEIDQTTATACTFRIKASGNCSASSPGDDYAMMLKLTDSSGNQVGYQSLHFPTGSFTDQQFTITVTPSAPAKYAYGDIYANVTSKLSFYDCEFFQEGGTQAKYGEWVSDPIDIAEQLNQTITETGMCPTKMTFFYGNPSNVNNMNSVEHSIAELSKFPIVILQSGDQNTDQRQKDVITGLLENGVKVFGYVAVTSAASMSDIQTHIQSCKTAGYYGVFLDEFGYGTSSSGGIGSNRSIQNQCLDYAHGLGLRVIGNGFPWECLDDAVDATYNPNGDVMHWNVDDWCLIESFYSGSDGTYTGSTNGFSDPYGHYYTTWQLKQVTSRTQPHICVLPYELSASNWQNDMNNSYLLACAFGFDGYAFGGNSGDQNVVSFDVLPTIPVGQKLLQPLLPSDANGNYHAVTDAGVIWFTATDQPNVTRSAGSFSTQINVACDKGTVPTIVANRTDVHWQTSNDGVTWSDADSTLPKGVRYVGYRARLYQ